MPFYQTAAIDKNPVEVLNLGGVIPNLLPYCEMLFIYYTIKCEELLSDRHSYVEDKIDESDLRKRKEKYWKSDIEFVNEMQMKDNI